MRLSIFDATRPRAMQSRVYLDGVEITNDCQVADDVDGFVVVVVRDRDGRGAGSRNMGASRLSPS